MTDEEIEELIQSLKSSELKLEELIQTLLTAPRIDRYALIWHFDQMRQWAKECRHALEDEDAPADIGD